MSIPRVTKNSFGTGTAAFNAIGATKQNGLPYRAVRGISVSASGRHFFFWEDEILWNADGEVAIERNPRNPAHPWFASDQGKKFYADLFTAKTSKIPVFIAVNRIMQPDPAC